MPGQNKQIYCLLFIMTLPKAADFSWSITYFGDVALTSSGHIQITPDSLFYIVPHS
jgi:hypothetical protein